MLAPWRFRLSTPCIARRSTILIILFINMFTSLSQAAFSSTSKTLLKARTRSQIAMSLSFCRRHLPLRLFPAPLCRYASGVYSLMTMTPLLIIYWYNEEMNPARECGPYPAVNVIEARVLIWHVNSIRVNFHFSFLATR
jgi:hypothetical protein